MRPPQGFSSEYIANNGDYELQAAPPESYGDGSNFARFAPDTTDVIIFLIIVVQSLLIIYANCYVTFLSYVRSRDFHRKIEVTMAVIKVRLRSQSRTATAQITWDLHPTQMRYFFLLILFSFRVYQFMQIVMLTTFFPVSALGIFTCKYRRRRQSACTTRVVQRQFHL